MNSPYEASTAELIALARRGDPSALNRLLETFRNYVKLIARLQIDKRVQAKIDPSDIVQETFMESCRHFDAFRGTTRSNGRRSNWRIRSCNRAVPPANMLSGVNIRCCWPTRSNGCRPITATCW